MNPLFREAARHAELGWVMGLHHAVLHRLLRGLDVVGLLAP